MYEDAVAELLDGSEGAGRANDCEVADSVDVGVPDEVPTTDVRFRSVLMGYNTKR